MFEEHFIIFLELKYYKKLSNNVYSSTETVLFALKRKKEASSFGLLSGACV